MSALKEFTKVTLLVVALLMFVIGGLFILWSSHSFPFNIPQDTIDICAATNVNFSTKPPTYTRKDVSQECIDQRFTACMATDKYSRSECIIIASRP